jgi:hypothetical protein
MPAGLPVPSLGKSGARFFQALENFRPLFPSLGTARGATFQSLEKTPRRVSNPWKTALLALALLAPVAAPALIFERWGVRGHDPVRNLMIGEQPAYSAPMKLNNGAGEMEVFMCEGSPSKILERLVTAYQALGGQVFCVSGGKLGWGLVLLDGKLIRLLVANTGQRNSSTVFRIEQTESEFARSRQVPARPLPGDVPVFPGSRWTQAIRNEAARSTVATATVGADANTVLRYYADVLPRAGWVAGLDPRDQASGLYTRGAELLLVNANSTGVRGQTVVILLHKKLK